MRIRLLYLAAVLTLVSCAEDVLPVTGSHPFDVTVSIAPLKTSSGEVVECAETQWDADDTIGVYAYSRKASNANVAFGYKGNGSFSGTLDWTDECTELDLYAFYGYRSNRGYDPTWLSARILAAQRQSGNVCCMESNTFLVGRSGTLDMASGTADVELTTPCAVLRFLVDASETLLTDKKMISLKASFNVPVVGNIIYDVLKNETVIKGNGKNVTLTFDEPVSLTEELNAYFFVMPLSRQEISIDIQAVCEDKSMLNASVSTEVAFESGRVCDIPLEISEMIAGGDASVSEYRVDLSEKSTSNCYIVTAEDKYRFLATMGNSSDKIEGIDRVDWLWASEADLITGIGYTHGYISFNGGGHPGNVILAAYDEDNDILWSWHIWITEELSLHSDISGTYQILDRNIGALSSDVDDPDSYGFYYQWGRKDPFAASSAAGTGQTVKWAETVAFENAAYVVNPLSDMDFSVRKNTEMLPEEEVEYTVSDPMTFIVFDVESNGSGQTWFNSDFSKHIELWGNTAKSKTRYDPCPVGYRVPEDMSKVYDGATEEHFAVTSMIGLKGMLFTGKSGSSYYPASGFRNQQNGRLSYVGSLGAYWSSMTYKNTTARALRLEDGADVSVHTNTKYPASVGLPVRCIKE